MPSFDGSGHGGQLGGAGISVSRASQNAAAAAKAAVTLSMPNIQATTYGLNGGKPGNITAWRDPDLNRETHDYFKNTLTTIENAWLRPRILGWPDIQFHSAQIVHKALVDKSFTAETIGELALIFERFAQE